MSPADLRRQTPKQQNCNNCNNLKQPVFLCGIMQPAAFLCVICAICGRITRKRTQSICTEETPIYLPLISQIYADKTTKPQNSNNCNSLKQPVFLCDIMQLCCIPLRDLRNLRENNTQEDSIYIAQMNGQCLPQISQIYADKTQNNKTTITALISNNLSFSAG